MKGSIRKTLMLTTLAMSVMVSIVGCSTNGNNSPNSSNTPVNTSAATNDGEEAVAESKYKDKYDPPVTISTVWGIDPTLTFKNGETIDNNVATQWALDTFGIEVKTLWSVTDTNGAFNTKLRLAMTSGQEMPDIVTINDKLLVSELIESGMFREVGSLFDEYANDTWKAAMNLDPNVWTAYTRNGERYGIPVLDTAYNSDYLLWIRQDWLDKLNLPLPRTLEELETVMDAFKNNNPDGLAPDKVVPLSVGWKTSMNTWRGDPSWVFGAFGTLPKQWNEAEDGSLEYGSINPGMKEGLIKLNEWYEKGYIPAEAALWDESKVLEPAVAGTAGIVAGPFWMIGSSLRPTVENVPHAVWKPLYIPTGPDGTAMRHGTHYVNGVTLINKNMKNPEAFFTYQNYLYENFANPQPGGVFEHGLFEGYDYVLSDNGEPLFTDEDIPGGAVNAKRYLLVRDGARIPDIFVNSVLNLADGKEPTTRHEKEAVQYYTTEVVNIVQKLMEQVDISKKDMFVGPTTETMKSRQDYLNKLEESVFNEIIYGKKGPEAFDEFVATWKSSGGDDITREVNEWYQSTK